MLAPGSFDDAVMGGQDALPARPRTRGPVMVGVVAALLFFGGLGTWSTLAPLTSAAVATGTVVVEGQRKTIQHLEGGIVGEILVADGDMVAEGQVLIRLDNTKARASQKVLGGRLRAAQAIEARLMAERDGHELIDFPEKMVDAAMDPAVAEILQGQTNIFDARNETIVAQTAILAQREAEYREEITGIQGQIRSEDQQIKLIAEEIVGVRTLFEKGLAKKPRLLQLMRRAADIEGSRNLHRAQIARARQSISEAKIRVNELKSSFNNEVVEHLRTVQAEIHDLQERINAAQDVLRRTAIRSPIAGSVVGRNVHTAGGVIQPGEPLMDIVPRDGRLVIEARINPQDIDVVHVGMNAEVRLTAFSQRNRVPETGNVTAVSADHLADPATGEKYYLAIVRIDGSLVILQPGMQAEVMIISEKRTALGYLLEPILDSFNRAFRET